jgi:histidine triad (HIT) family protein
MNGDSEPCAFCDIVAGRRPATTVYADEETIAFLDVRQFHPGHVLVIPRRHIADIRDVNEPLAGVIMATVAKVARAVDAVFPNDGLSVWHSAGPGANQEVPHLHVHVHPRRFGDGMLRIYPRAPDHPNRETLDEWGARLRDALATA